MSDNRIDRRSLSAQQTVEQDARPDPEVVPRARRRQFSAAYKLRIVTEADACTASGEIGALLRREGLSDSLLSRWRDQRRRGSLGALAPVKRGPKVDPLATENARLRRENERLQKQLQHAETIIEVQKKLSVLLGLTANDDVP